MQRKTIKRETAHRTVRVNPAADRNALAFLLDCSPEAAEQRAVRFLLTYLTTSNALGEVSSC